MVQSSEWHLPANTFDTHALTQLQNQIVDVPNTSLIKDPTMQLPGMNLPRGQWTLTKLDLNSNVYKWGYVTSPL